MSIQPQPTYAPESHFTAVAVTGGVTITKYTGPGGEVLIPPTIGGQQVVAIGEEAFYDQASLEKVIIPEGVTALGDLAIAFCDNLVSVTLPASVTRFGYDPFDNDLDLVLHVHPGTPAQQYAEQRRIPYELIGLTPDPTSPFTTAAAADGVAITGYTGSAAVVMIPAAISGRKVVAIGENAFQGMTQLTSVLIPTSVTSIGSFAFEGCTGLSSIAIPESVTSIGQGAFEGCKGLTSIILPEGLRVIDRYTFTGCTSLTGVKIPASVTRIELRAFFGCAALATVAIPEGVTSIGQSAFAGCTGLTTATIPKSVQDIADDAFAGCTNVTLRAPQVCPAHRYALKNHLPFEQITP